MQLISLAGMRTSTCITCSNDGTGKLGEGIRAASWVPLGTPRGSRPPDAKGVSALGEGGEMRTTSRLQLCRRKPDDGLWARSVRSACAGTGPSGYQHNMSAGLGGAHIIWPCSSELTVTKLRVCNSLDNICKMQQQYHFGAHVAPATTSQDQSVMSTAASSCSCGQLACTTVTKAFAGWCTWAGQHVPAAAGFSNDDGLWLACNDAVSPPLRAVWAVRCLSAGCAPLT